MLLSYTSIIPPLLVLSLGIMTHRVFFSLLSGVLSAALIAKGGNLLTTSKLLGWRLFESSGLHNIGSFSAILGNDELLLFIFLGNLGIIVTLLEYSGGATAYAAALTERLKTKRQVEQTSLLLSLCFFIDDYFSSLTVGTIMRPLTDKFRIPRVKLAFLVDSMSAPLAIMVPISSWVAVIISQLMKVGISPTATATTTIIADPFFVYLSSVPFILYSLIMIISAFFIVRSRISFGAMRQHEIIAEKDGNMHGGKEAPRKMSCKMVEARDGGLFDFFAPLSIFLGSVACGLLYTGNHWWFGGPNSFVMALRMANSSLALAIGSIIAVSSTCSLLLARRTSWNTIGALLQNGIALMSPAIIILWLSWTLGSLMRLDLLTGEYLAQTLLGSVPMALFPLMFFLASGVISFAMGSSWGAVAIMIPIAVPMTIGCAGLIVPVAIAQLPIILPVLGAILSGAVLGDHISPISDTTIMSSTSSCANHIDHVYTQFLYVLPIFSATCCAFLVAGITCSWGASLSALSSLTVGGALSVLLLWLAHHSDSSKDGIS